MAQVAMSLTFRFCLNHLIYVSDIPFLSQSPYLCFWHSVSVSITLSLSLTFRFYLNRPIYVSDIPFLSQSPYICLWHSVSVSITLSLLLTFRFCLNHLISVSDISFLSQSSYLCLWHSVSVSITLSLSLWHSVSLSHSPCTVYISRSVSFLLNYLSLSLITSFLADTLYGDSKVSSIVSFFHFVLFCHSRRLDSCGWIPTRQTAYWRGI
jgi:hypothetical protein